MPRPPKATPLARLGEAIGDLAREALARLLPEPEPEPERIPVRVRERR